MDSFFNFLRKMKPFRSWAVNKGYIFTFDIYPALTGSKDPHLRVLERAKRILDEGSTARKSPDSRTQTKIATSCGKV